MKPILSILCLAILLVACKKAKVENFVGLYNGSVQFTYVKLNNLGDTIIHVINEPIDSHKVEIDIEGTDHFRIKKDYVLRMRDMKAGEENYILYNEPLTEFHLTFTPYVGELKYVEQIVHHVASETVFRTYTYHGFRY
jgi:hypothetical protein